MTKEETYKSEDQFFCGVCGVDDVVEDAGRDAEDDPDDADETLEEGEIRA